MASAFGDRFDRFDFEDSHMVGSSFRNVIAGKRGERMKCSCCCIWSVEGQCTHSDPSLVDTYEVGEGGIRLMCTAFQWMDDGELKEIPQSRRGWRDTGANL